MSDMIISPELFEVVRQAVFDVCTNCHQNPKIVLTESDLQAHLFGGLAHDPRLAALSNDGIDFHCNFNFKKSRSELGWIPDLVMLPQDAYSVDPRGELYDRKGYTVTGSAIALELKLVRAHRRSGIEKKIQKDIKKLRDIQRLHYSDDPDHSFFGASVVFCKRSLPDDMVERLRSFAIEKRVPLWLFNPEGE